jgi:hypothetical protein
MRRVASSDGAARLVARLEEVQHRFTAADRAAKHAALTGLAARSIADPSRLLRFHEALLFLRAYPDDRALLARVDQALEAFAGRVAALRRPDRLDETGLAGTAIYCPLSYAAACWLTARFPAQVELDWDDADSEERLAALLPRLSGPAAEDALVEVGVPVRAWLTAAKAGDGRSDLAWLLDRLGRDPAGEPLYDAAAPRTRWALGRTEGSRTRARVEGPRVFFHRGRLGRWRGPLARRLPGARVPVRHAVPREAVRLLDAARAAVLVRYREVHAFNFADPAAVLVADAGRGLQIAWFGVRPDRRLPLRAHFGYLLLKNGVPVGYGDASLLFDWVEVAFNVFATFRRGESAFAFVRLLAFLAQRFRVRVFRLSPYQLGRANEEAIASGAFWFYYKLGFRPTRPDLARLARREAARIAARPGYRSAAPVLRQLAQGVMLTGRGPVAPTVAAFDVQQIARAAAARPGASEGRDLDAVARAVGARRWRAWAPSERTAFERWAAVLGLLPDLARWPVHERRAVLAVIRTKGARPEEEYLRRLRAHPRLRARLLQLGRPGGPTS